MSKKNGRKLSLNRDTMKNLSEAEMGNANGAGYVVFQPIWTLWTCPHGGGGIGTASGTCFPGTGIFGASPYNFALNLNVGSGG